jgi:hypothetical protein
MIAGIIVAQTDKAIQFAPDEKVEPVWIPKSICEYIFREGGIVPTKGRIRLPMWKVRDLKWEGYDKQ